MSDSQIVVPLPSSMKEAVKGIARSEDRSIAAQVREFIREGIERVGISDAHPAPAASCGDTRLGQSATTNAA